MTKRKVRINKQPLQKMLRNIKDGHYSSRQSAMSMVRTSTLGAADKEKMTNAVNKYYAAHMGKKSAPKTRENGHVMMQAQKPFPLVFHQFASGDSFDKEGVTNFLRSALDAELTLPELVGLMEQA